MPLEQTLARIETEIASGDCGKARDRLHGLVASYPDDLSLRRRLGDVYWKLQYPAMAGRYWYLEEETSPSMDVAREAFERSRGRDPLKLLLALRFRGDLEAIRGAYAGQRLLTLHEEAKARHRHYVDFREQGPKRYREALIEGPPKTVLLIGCVLGVLIAVVLMIAGAIYVVEWAF